MSDWLKNIRIGIVGNGVVGQAVARSYLEHVAEVRCYDEKPERRTHWLTSCEPGSAVLDCDVVFVCLPTPQKANSLEADLGPIERFFDHLAYLPDVYPDRVRTTNFVLRSTVPIGTTRRLAEKYRLPNLVHSPEFLTARCATVDAQMPARNIIGMPKRYGEPCPGDCERTNSSGQHWFRSGSGLDQMCGYCGRDVRDSGAKYLLPYLYEERFPHIPVLTMTSDESEFTKLAQNSFFAVKISVWNELRCLADKLGLGWDMVRNAILADGRIHPSHTQVPGPDGKYGFGGACIRKDLANLIDAMDELGMRPTETLYPNIMRAAYDRNENDRKRGESK